MTLKDRITEDMKNAMRAKAAARLSTIRLLLAAIKQREIDERRELPDADVVSVLERMVKQRKESISQFTAGNRLDLAAAEQAEIGILEAYLPQKMSEAEITGAIDAALAAAKAAGASGPALMGKVMAALKPALAGRADMAEVSARVKARL
ncbi:MAG: GatB/YqeY domain-containing protein [Betaproteobacteria bacterium]|nr:GatB/YqeY domain-containing protein [Betaproteobacteria bacterium]